MPQFQPVGVECLPPFGTGPLDVLQPAQAPVQIRKVLEVWPVRRAVHELLDPGVAGGLRREEFLTLFPAAEIADQVPET